MRVLVMTTPLPPTTPVPDELTQLIADAFTLADETPGLDKLADLLAEALLIAEGKV